MKEETYDNESILIAKYLAEEASAQEIEQLEIWANQNAQNQSILEQSKKIFELSKEQLVENTEPLKIDIDQEWSKFKNSIKPEAKTFSIFKSTPFYRMAAAFLLLCTISAVVYFAFFKSNEYEYYAAEDPQTITLTDGSVVTLNRNSHLSHRDDFGKETRTLLLQGEAYFDVAADKNKPFIINTTAGKVTVLGTSFNVEESKTIGQTLVTVAEGVVKFGLEYSSKAVILKAGEQGRLDHEKGLLKIVPNTNVNFDAWKTRKIVFVESDLNEVVAVLNKVYDAHIVIGNISQACTVTVTFNRQSLEEVLTVLSATLDLELDKSDTAIIITRAGC